MYSILFPNEEEYKDSCATEMPDYFKDLNLDQIVSSITQGRSEFGLERFFFTPLRDYDTIIYRQEIMHDLDNITVFQKISLFARTIYTIQKNMSKIKKDLLSAENYHNNYLTKGHLLDEAELYCNAISTLITEIDLNTLHSNGLRSFLEYVISYTTSEFFVALTAYIKKLRADLSTVEYCMLIKNANIKVRKYEQQKDHSKQIVEIFDKFKQDESKDYRHNLSEEPSAEHVEAAVLDMVASWYKDIFNDLNRFCKHFINFTDDKITVFAREVQFYLSYQEYIRNFRNLGLHFCYPKICTNNEHIYNFNGFDLALAGSLLPDSVPVINDFMLNTPEQIIIVTGPNQGGKTTFARTFGQMHHLACIGCPIPGTDASLLLFDYIYTHFESEEDLSTLNGKLQDDLMRLYRIFKNATRESIIIINEIFASTTLQDALLLSRQMLNQIVDLGALAVCVTFLDELASHCTEIVSMMSTVNNDNPTQRTYKIVRKKADGLAYAIHIAQKHGLTYEILCRRLQV